MKFLSVLVLFLSSVGFAAIPPDSQLSPLKPIKYSDLVIGELKTQLVDGKSNEVLAEGKSTLGDCKDCVRGIVLRNRIGVRFMGKNLKELKVLHKQVGQVYITDCRQGAAAIENKQFDCEFLHDGHPYKLLFTMAPNSSLMK
jgi:hypothetical protein